MKTMLSFREAVDILSRYALSLGVEEKYFTDSLGHYLAEPISSPLFYPPFTNSAMDGFALRSEETRGAGETQPKTFKIVATLGAGDSPNVSPTSSLPPFSCAAIMTGALCPDPWDAVIPLEQVERQGEMIILQREVKPLENLRLKGEDLKEGNPVLGRATLLTPALLSLLAALGISRVKVFRKPTVGVLATGNELVGVEDPLTPGKIRDSNSYLLIHTLQKAGYPVHSLGLVRDHLDEIRGKVHEAQKTADVLLISGGVSMGEFDFVKQALDEEGYEPVFWKLQIKPAKPLFFGVTREGEEVEESGSRQSAVGSQESRSRGIGELRSRGVEKSRSPKVKGRAPDHQNSKLQTLNFLSAVEESKNPDVKTGEHFLRKFVFGIPGNPISTLATLHVFVLPFLEQLSSGGQPFHLHSQHAILDRPLIKSDSRYHFIPARAVLEEGTWHVSPTRKTGSGMVSALAANALILMDEATQALSKGDKASLLLLL